MNKLIAVPVIALALLTGACTKHAAVPSATASAEKQKAEQYVATCVPQNNTLAQIQLAKQLGTDPASRTKLAQCLGIPQDQRQNFEADALSAAEHIKWSDKDQRSQYFEVTLPNLALKYRSTK